ncbi:Rib/alpha-like domain-containing protein [Mammaliicoccus fleurettii]|uniref:Rib/alpha-like domain-containing protein n=1 Tax=Mammaliicoccus fleurettii TaxID=150056 RepID=UPI001AADF455|nr:Rib/alpha-like domain-containing protein [Mammaliicoccus fleurettii]MBO3062544.1 YPDG domain-containing protein [Mammaliicoccus fleurettii]
MDNQRRLQKFSIRKYTIGTCSILIGTLLFLGNPSDKAFASAKNIDVTNQEESVKPTETTNDTSNELSNQNTNENVVQNNEAPTDKIKTNEQIEEQSIVEETDNQTSKVENETTQEEKNTENSTYKEENTLNKDTIVTKENNKELDKPVNNVNQSIKASTTTNTVDQHNSSSQQTPDSEIKTNLTEPENNKKTIIEKNNSNEAIQNRNNNEINNTNNNDNNVTPKIVKATEVRTNKMTVEEFKKLSPREIFSIGFEELKKLNIQTFYSDLTRAQQKALALNKSFQSYYGNIYPAPSLSMFRAAQGPYPTGIAQEYDFGPLGDRDFGGNNQGDQFHLLAAMQLENVAREGDNAVIRYKIRFNDNSANRGSMKYYFAASEGNIKILRLEKNGQSINTNNVYTEDLNKTFKLKRPQIYNDIIRDFIHPLTSQVKVVYGKRSDKIIVEFEVRVPLTTLLSKYEDPTDTSTGDHKFKSFVIGAGGLNTAIRNKQNTFRVRGVYNTTISPTIHTDLTEKANTKTPVVVYSLPGLAIKLYDKSNNVIGEGIVQSNGKAPITPTVDIPAGDVTARIVTKGRELFPSAPKVATRKETDADRHNPTAINQTVEINETPSVDQSISLPSGTPNGTRYEYITQIDTQTVGDKNATVRVTYPDNSYDDVPVVIEVIDTTPPVAPTLQNKTNERNVAIQPITIPNATDNSGDVEPSSVTGLPPGLTYNSQTKQITGTPTTEGTSRINVEYVDPSGNSIGKNFKFTVVDTTPPNKPVIQTDLTGKAGTTPTIAVNAEPRSNVKLYDKDGNKIGEGVANDQGVAQITPTTPLTEGNITAKATDNAATPNTSVASDPIKATDTTPPAKPVITTDLTGKAGTTPTISVNVEAGSNVELFDKDGNKIGQGVANNQGVVEITPTTPLTEGNVTARATDNAESPNTSAASDPVKATDTTAPAKPVITTDLIGKAGTTPAISVNAEPGSNVELFDKNGHKIGQGVANNQGVAQITPTMPLPEGNITAKAIDNAETPNTSVASDPIKATDTTPPAKPVIITDTTPPAKPVIITDLAGKAGTTPTISVNAEPGSNVEIFNKDGNKIGEAKANNQGIAQITPTMPLPEGNITAKAIDNAETPNTSVASDPIKATDTTPPAKPVITTDLTGQAHMTPTISVNAEAGSNVELFDKDGNKIGEAKANDQGVAQITPTTPLPEGNITAKATDNAETPNTSVASDSMKATDTTAPAKPVITTDLTNKAGTTPTISVNAEPNSKVEIFDKDGNKIGESKANNQGIAQITSTMPLPEGNITAKATDNAESPNTSDASDPVKATDTTAPSKPVITTDLTGQAYMTPTISVNAEPNSKVEIFDKGGNKIGEAVANNQGIAQITPTTPLPEGNITAKATDNAETPNTSDASDPVKATDTTAPAKPVITTDLTGKAGTTEPITVTTDPGSNVELFDKDGNKIGEGIVNDQGVAEITPTTPLPEGNITAKATDNAESPNTSDASDPIKATDTTAPIKPVITTDLTGQAYMTPTISVNAEPGSTVELFDKDGNKIGESVANDQGIAEITPTTRLPEGNITAKATDNAESPNTSDASDPIKATDTTAPVKPVITTDLTGQAHMTPTISVNAEPKSKVEIFDKDGNKIGEGVANDQGVAEITPTRPLPEGNITAKATDNAETPNTSDASDPIKVTDTTAPAKPVITTDLTGKAHMTPIISVNAEPGSNVEIFDKDGNKIGESVANDQGIAEITPTTPLPEGNITAKATDNAETPNTSDASDPIKATDTTAPVKPIITTDLTSQAHMTPTISVNAEPGSNVELFDKDGNKIGEGMANDQGVAEITPTTPLPEGNITAKATDNAESPNTSDASDPIKATDTTAPVKPVITTDLTGQAHMTPTISVNAEPGSTVELFDKDGNKIGEGVTNDQGVAEITPTTPLPEGNITAKATDNAETPNTSDASEPVKSKDTTPPTKPVIQTDLSGKGGTKDPISVTTDPGTKVEIFDKDGNKIGEGIANDQGVAEITPTIPLPEGNITAKATDNAETPNTSDASDPVKSKDITPPSKPLIQTDLTDKGGTKDPITVTTDPGNKVEIFDKDGNKIGEGVANDQGVAKITPTTPLPEGNITAKATDNAETPNTSDASDPVKSKDTTPPSKPVIQTDLTGKGGTQDPIVVKADPGTKVEIFDKDGNKIGEGVANNQGIAKITPTKPLPEGNITAKATDNAETPNTSDASEPVKSKDTTQSTKPDTQTDLTGKASTKDPIIIISKPGYKVEIFDKDGNKVGEGIANDQGIVEIIPTAPLPENKYTAKVTGKAESPIASDNSKLKLQSNPTDMINNKVKDVDKNKPGYGDNPINISPDKSITVPQIGDGKLPKNTKFEIPGATVPSKWNIKINSKTGALSVTPPANVISGTKQTIPVKVTYPDGSTEIVNVKIIVNSKESGHDMSNSRKTENKDSVQTIKSHELIEPHNQNKLSNNKLESALKDTSIGNEQNKITKNKEMNNENVSKTEVLPNTGEQPIENTTLFGTLFASVGALFLFGRRKDKKEEN